MAASKLRPIILAGGIGERLWPLSTKEVPKQFIPLSEGDSLFDLTLKRIKGSNLFKKPIIVTLKQFKEEVISSLKKNSLEPSLVVLEPIGKNTCPALLAAVTISLKKNGNETFITLPSDHHILSNTGFEKSCFKALSSSKSNHLTLFGVKPRYPSTQFGYMKISSEDSPSNVLEFIEKPDKKLATSIFNKRKVYWNAGIFMFQGSWFLDQINSLSHDLLETVSQSIDSGIREKELILLDKKSYKKIKGVSIDVALVEKCKEVKMNKLHTEWSDLGSWIELSEVHNNPSIPISLYQEKSIERDERPWGYYEVLKETEETKLKIIRVMPKQKLSLQKHNHRTEKWHMLLEEKSNMFWVKVNQL